MTITTTPATSFGSSSATATTTAASTITLNGSGNITGTPGTSYHYSGGGGIVSSVSGSVSGGWTVGNWSNTISVPSLSLVGGNRPVIKIEDGEIDLKLLMTMMQQMKAILCVIEEDMQRHEKYPALKELYDQFKIVEAMVKSDEED